MSLSGPGGDAVHGSLSTSPSPGHRYCAIAPLHQLQVVRVTTLGRLGCAARATHSVRARLPATTFLFVQV